MGGESRKKRGRLVAAINATASVITVVQYSSVVGAALFAWLQQPVAALAAAALAGAVTLLLLGKRVASVGYRVRRNQRAEPLLRAALVSVAEAGRIVASRDPARGFPSADALRDWNPELGTVDRILRRVDLEASMLAYLLWLLAYAIAATMSGASPLWVAESQLEAAVRTSTCRRYWRRPL